MTPSPRFLAVLLAAGASRRFGGDKLMAPVGGRLVLERAAVALAGADCRWKTAIVRANDRRRKDLLCALGYDMIENNDADSGVALSIKAGIRYAQALKADGVLIALADMPFVATHHFNALIERAWRSADGLAFSIAHDLRSPPAAFLSPWFARLLALEGDRGAGDMLRAADADCGVNTNARTLCDIDTPLDLELCRTNNFVAGISLNSII